MSLNEELEKSQHEREAQLTKERQEWEKSQSQEINKQKDWQPNRLNGDILDDLFSVGGNLLGKAMDKGIDKMYEVAYGHKVDDLGNPSEKIEQKTYTVKEITKELEGRKADILKENREFATKAVAYAHDKPLSEEIKDDRNKLREEYSRLNKLTSEMSDNKLQDKNIEMYGTKSQANIMRQIDTIMEQVSVYKSEMKKDKSLEISR